MTAAFAPLPAPKLSSSPIHTAPEVADSLAVERAAIDASTRAPVLFFLTNAVLWLLFATVVGVITSIQLHVPGFLADVPALTYGRLWPVYTNALAYGWACSAGMGVGIWLLARLCRVRIRIPAVLATGAIFWNVGLTIGIVSLLAGRTTGVEWLELPPSATVIMFIGYALIGLWGALLFGFRRDTPAYISVWYLVAGFLWFPWSFAVGHISNAVPNLDGVLQNVIAAWAMQNFTGVWLTSIGLGAAYYLIPKVVHRPIYSYNLAAIGFWTFLIFAGLTGMTRLSGGPIPAWLVTLSISASILLLVQIATVSANLILTMRGQYHMVYHSPTIRFTFFGAIAFTIASVIGLLTSLRSVDRVLHFTQFQTAQMHLVIYAFYSMIMFGAIYYILPRLVGCEWLSSSMISMHFWGSAYGGGMMISMLLFGGLASGLAFVDPDATFPQIIQMGEVYLPGRSIAWGIMALGHVIFAFHFLLMLLRIGQPGGQATLFVATAGKDAH